MYFEAKLFCINLKLKWTSNLINHCFSDDSDDCVPYSKEACEEAATSLDLKKGGAGSNFAGSYARNGCYAYDKGEYNDMAFYGTGGSDGQKKEPFDANSYEQYGIYRPMGYDCESNLFR